MTPPLHKRFWATFFNAFAWYLLQPESFSCGMCDEEFHHIQPAEQHFEDEHPEHLAHFDMGEGE